MKKTGWTVLIIGNLIGLVWAVVAIGSSIPYGAINGRGPHVETGLVIAAFATVVGIALLLYKPTQEPDDKSGDDT